jgi:hypothetical protein
MSVFLDIQTALDSRLYQLPNAPQIAWPNTKYVPQNTTTYLRPTLLPANSTLYTLNNEDGHSGIYQIDIYVQADKGTNQLLTLADNIRDHFNSQKSLSKNDNVIHIQEISIGVPQREDQWYSCFVAVNYICFAN